MKKHVNRRVKSCIFAGPSLYGLPDAAGIDTLPPAGRGDIEAAIRAGYTHLGMIDGAIEDDAVPVSELRNALEHPDIRLWGAASMGAVRAAELNDAGMRGVGRAYRLLRRGALSSEEVYLLHAPAALKHRPLTLPLINIRYTLRRMRHAGELSPSQEADVVAYMLDVPWFDRDHNTMVAAMYEACGGTRCRDMVRAFDRLYRDVKQEDALRLLSLMARTLPAPARRRVQMSAEAVHAYAR